jgi:hypothetical protein
MVCKANQEDNTRSCVWTRSTQYPIVTPRMQEAWELSIVAHGRRVRHACMLATYPSEKTMQRTRKHLKSLHRKV